jgi:hypothetical protein
VHAPSKEKSDASKDSFYEELEQVFNHFSKKSMKILLGDINANVGRENILKPTMGMKVYIRIVMIMVLE